MLLDLTDNGRCVNPSKYVLYNDLFNGLMDKTITDDLADEHKALSRKLSLLTKDENYGYLFETMKALCDVVALKADLGIRIRKAYDAKNIDELKLVISDCKKLKKLMEVFYDRYEKQWMTENKAVGFDVQDIRIGGMIARVAHCTKRLEKFVNGEIPNIDELENTLGRHIASKEDMLAGCYELLDRGAKRVLLSLGKQGAVITDGTHNYYCKSMNVAVNSTVGAGDGMVAAAALQLEQDAPLSEILRAGVAAGTATVMTAGQVSFTKEKYAEVIANLRVTEI
jgi:bifunctional ADP-heptose synthase (sugar kinase/adenylyltransferase)